MAEPFPTKKEPLKSGSFFPPNVRSVDRPKDCLGGVNHEVAREVKVDLVVGGRHNSIEVVARLISHPQGAGREVARASLQSNGR